VDKNTQDEGDDSQSFASFWSWYIAINELAKDDITKIPEVVKTPLVSVLNHLSYMKDVSDIREREMRKQESKFRR
jgi:hypothetical protein